MDAMTAAECAAEAAGAAMASTASEQEARGRTLVSHDEVGHPCGLVTWAGLTDAPSAPLRTGSSGSNDAATPRTRAASIAIKPDSGRLVSFTDGMLSVAAGLGRTFPRVQGTIS